MPRELAETDMFVLLSARRRRLALRVLQESETPLTPKDLAVAIAKREGSDPSHDELNDVYLTLFHQHLPKLDSADVIVHDREREAVSPGVNFDSLVTMLDRTDHRDLPWTDGRCVGLP